MQKRPKQTAVPRPGNRDQNVNKHLLALVGLAAVWIGIFVVVLVEHARSWARLLPAVGVVFILYAAYVTWRVIRYKRSR